MAGFGAAKRLVGKRLEIRIPHSERGSLEDPSVQSCGEEWKGARAPRDDCCPSLVVRMYCVVVVLGMLFTSWRSVCASKRYKAFTQCNAPSSPRAAC